MTAAQLHFKRLLAAFGYARETLTAEHVSDAAALIADALAIIWPDDADAAKRATELADCFRELAREGAR